MGGIILSPADADVTEVALVLRKFFPRFRTGTCRARICSLYAFVGADRTLDSLFLWRERIAGGCAMSEYSVYTITDDDRRFPNRAPSFTAPMTMKLFGRQCNG